MRTNKRYSPEQKTLIIRELLKNRTPISTLAEKYDVHPNVIYSWEKTLFEGAIDIFSKGKEKAKNPQNDKNMEELKKTLLKRNEVISELIQENLALKKSLGET